jgi:hypothetical protein
MPVADRAIFKQTRALCSAVTSQETIMALANCLVASLVLTAMSVPVAHAAALYSRALQLTALSKGAILADAAGASALHCALTLSGADLQCRSAPGASKLA